MKKLFALATIVFLIASCSEDVTNSNSDGSRYVAFSVTDDDMGQRQDAPTRSFVSSSLLTSKLVKVETNLPTDAPLYLSVTDEPFIRQSSSSAISRGALQGSGNATSLSFAVTEYPTGEEDIANVKWVNSNPEWMPQIELFKAPFNWELNAYDGVRYDFYAYAPWVDNGTDRGIKLSENYQAITYDATGVPVGEQPDLMTARKWTSSYVGAIPLNFQHRLCAIQIKTGGTWATDYRVSAVQFQNVISSGTFHIDSDKDAAWISYGGRGTYDVTGFTQANASNTIMAGEGGTWLMMVPQMLTNVKLNITLTDASSHSYTITADVSSSLWMAGHTVTYTVSPGSISSMTVSYPSGTRRWSTGSGYVDGPVTSYKSGEQFGLFVVDKDGKILVSNGIAKTSTAGSSSTLVLPSNVFYSKQYKYFLMYPYRSDLSTLVGSYAAKYAVNSTNTASTADAFFSDVITRWTPAADQSSGIESSDLQVAVLTGDNFVMTHQMGLAGITLNSATVYDSYTYTYTSTSNQGTPVRTGGNTWYASSTMSSANKPYRPNNTNTMAYIVKKPGEAAYTVTATQSNVFATYKSTRRYAWSASVSAIAAKGNYVSSTVSYGGPAYLQAIWNIPFLKGIVTYSTPYAGKYQFECWGGSGGNGYSTFFHTAPQTSQNNNYRMATSAEQSNGSCYSYGGAGGYTLGILASVAQSRNFYICVGGGGTNTGTSRTNYYPPAPLYRLITGGYNGGGNGVEYEKSANQYVHYGGGGGGATHVATASGLLSSLTKQQVLMVAGAGGGGGGHEQQQTGGAGGNTTGGLPRDTKYAFETAQGGTQSAGGGWLGTLTRTAFDASTKASKGNWGAGGSNTLGTGGGGAGGGAGYYGGAGGYWGAGAGGSSYINGYSGCTRQNATYVFTGAGMTVGSSVTNKPTTDKNGYARITYTYIP